MEDRQDKIIKNWGKKKNQFLTNINMLQTQAANLESSSAYNRANFP